MTGQMKAITDAAGGVDCVRALLVHLRDNALPYNVRQKLEAAGDGAVTAGDEEGSWLEEGEAEKIFRAGVEALLGELGK